MERLKQLWMSVWVGGCVGGVGMVFYMLDHVARFGCASHTLPNIGTFKKLFIRVVPHMDCS